MSKNNLLLGIIGLTCLLFGVTAYYVLGSDEFHVIQLHIVFGSLLLVWFLIKGGLGSVRKFASRGAGRFVLAAGLYSSLFLGLLAIPNYFFYRHDPLQFDSTEQKVFTLAPQTTDVLAALEKPVLGRAFFIGSEVPEEVRDLLDRMAKASAKFRWTTIDPEKSPTITEELGINEKDTLHLSFDDAGDGASRSVKVIRTLSENDVVNGLLKLSRGTAKNLYVLGGHGEGDLQDPSEAGFLFLKEAIEGENINVQMLKTIPASGIPTDADALLIVSPKKQLLAAEVERIQQYLQGGGHAIFLHDPRTTDDVPNLVRPLGITIENAVVLDQVLRLLSAPGIGVQPVVTDYGSHPIVSGFKEATVFTTVAPVRVDDSTQSVKRAPLAFTGTNSWGERDTESLFSEQPSANLDPNDIRGPIAVAAAFEGPISFTESAAAASSRSRIVVFGDSDFVNNQNIRELFNRDLFLNALNWTVGYQDGASIRAKTMRRSIASLTPEQFRGIFLFSALLLPELVILAGFSVWWYRKGA